MKKNQICICNRFWRIRSVIRFVFSFYEDRLHCRGCGETKTITCQSKLLKFSLLVFGLVIFVSLLMLLTSIDPPSPDTNGEYTTRSDASRETMERFPIFRHFFWGVPSFLITFFLMVPLSQFALFLCWRKHWVWKDFLGDSNLVSQGRDEFRK